MSCKNCTHRGAQCVFAGGSHTSACRTCQKEKKSCRGAKGLPAAMQRRVARKDEPDAQAGSGVESDGPRTPKKARHEGKGKERARETEPPQVSGSGVWTLVLGAVWAAEPGAGLSTDGLLLRLVGEVQGLRAELAEFRPEIASLRDSVERVRAANRQYRAELTKVIPEARQLKSRLAALEDYYRGILGEEIAGESEEESAEETERRRGRTTGEYWGARSRQRNPRVHPGQMRRARRKGRWRMRERGQQRSEKGRAELQPRARLRGSDLGLHR